MTSTKQTKNNKQKQKNTNTIQKTKKISNMDPTKNNKGKKQHNTLQKTKKIGSMDLGLFCSCHRLVSCVASVASVSGLSILDHLLQFPLTFIRKKKNTTAIWHCNSWQCKKTMRRQF
jgi:hypothetical protein